MFVSFYILGITWNIFNFFFFIIYKDGSFETSKILKQLKNSTLEPENNFKPIKIFINNMDKLKKKELTKREHLQKTLGMIRMIG